MPARNYYHDLVKKAILKDDWTKDDWTKDDWTKDDWTITTHDPYQIELCLDSVALDRSYFQCLSTNPSQIG